MIREILNWVSLFFVGNKNNSVYHIDLQQMV